jgi:hypothetical protein
VGSEVLFCSGYVGCGPLSVDAMYNALLPCVWKYYIPPNVVTNQKFTQYHNLCILSNLF